MATAVAPAELREYLSEQLFASHSRVVVEYYSKKRDPSTAHAVDKAARWLRRHPAGHPSASPVRVICVDIDEGGGGARAALAALGVRLLPQPSTVVIYGARGRVIEARAGPLVSSKDLVTRLQL